MRLRYLHLNMASALFLSLSLSPRPYNKVLGEEDEKKI